jgi:hypothetical protein
MADLYYPLQLFPWCAKLSLVILLDVVISVKHLLYINNIFSYTAWILLKLSWNVPGMKLFQSWRNNLHSMQSSCSHSNWKKIQELYSLNIWLKEFYWYCSNYNHLKPQSLEFRYLAKTKKKNKKKHTKQNKNKKKIRKQTHCQVDLHSPRNHVFIEYTCSGNLKTSSLKLQRLELRYLSTLVISTTPCISSNAGMCK